MGENMQYNKNEFNGYLKNYLDINKQIDNIKHICAEKQKQLDQNKILSLWTFGL